MSSLNESLGISKVNLKKYKLLTDKLVDKSSMSINQQEIQGLNLLKLDYQDSNTDIFVDANYNPIDTDASPRVIIVYHNRLVKSLENSNKISGVELLEVFKKASQKDKLDVNIHKDSTTRKLIFSIESSKQQEETQESQNKEENKGEMTNENHN